MRSCPLRRGGLQSYCPLTGLPSGRWCVKQPTPGQQTPWRWLLIPVALLAGVLQGPAFVQSLRPQHDEVRDFFQEWASGKNYREGLPIYTDQTIAVQRYLDAVPTNRLYIHVNAHPPSSVLVALPLSWLSYADAFLTWNLLSLGALAVSLALIVRQLQIPCTIWWLLAGAALLLVCAPFREQVLHGQLNLILLLLIVGAWAAERSGRPVLGGVLIGLATAIKLFPGFFILYFALRREWRSLAAAIIGLGAVTLLTLAIFGLDAYRDYLSQGMPAAAACRGDWLNASLAGFWSRLFGPSNDAHAYASPAIGTTATALSLLVVLASGRPSRDSCENARRDRLGVRRLVDGDAPGVADHLEPLLRPAPAAAGTAVAILARSRLAPLDLSCSRCVVLSQSALAGRALRRQRLARRTCDSAAAPSCDRRALLRPHWAVCAGACRPVEGKTAPARDGEHEHGNHSDIVRVICQSVVSWSKVAR